MSKIISDNNLLASLAVFRELNQNGKNTNEILTEFLIDIIKTKQLYSFSVTKINSLLHEMYDFQIPDAVISIALRKVDFLSFEYQLYSISNQTKLSQYDLEEQKQNKIEENNKVFEKLYQYIENKTKRTLNEQEKSHIQHAFASFILDNLVDNGYSNYISAFIIENEENKEFMNTLKTIKEGVILYVGLKYNPHIQAEKPWNTKLTIYLSMEIIFHIAGYNGSLFQTLFKDLYELIKEINSKKKYIYLKYLHETETEIESYFYSAECIVQGKSGFAATTSAMRNIVNGCKDLVNVIAKKKQLFDLLNKMGILKEESDEIYGEESHKYNVITSSLLKKYAGNIDRDSFDDTMNKLNYISVKRGKREQNNFENIGYILLTESRKINGIAWDEEVKEKGQVPLATNMQFLTNKLWFKLNKGFGDGKYPISFNVTTKAQILLSSHISEKLTNGYSELQKEVSSGQINEETALKVLYELKSRMKLPEEIHESNIPSVLSTLEETLDEYVLDHENTIKIAKETTQENIKLQKSLEESLLSKEKKEKEAEHYKQKYLQEQIDKFNILDKKKNDIDKKSDTIFKREQILGFLAYFASLIFLASRYIDWNIFEKWAWVASSLLLPPMIFIFKSKIKIIAKVMENRKKVILNNLYMKDHINIEEYEELKTRNKKFN